MTVNKLIEKLKECNQDKVVVLTDPEVRGRDNIGVVIEDISDVKITIDGNGLFHE